MGSYGMATCLVLGLCRRELGAGDPDISARSTPPSPPSPEQRALLAAKMAVAQARQGPQHNMLIIMMLKRDIPNLTAARPARRQARRPPAAGDAHHLGHGHLQGGRLCGWSVGRLGGCGS
jgi:hypothetical protein